MQVKRSWASAVVLCLLFGALSAPSTAVGEAGSKSSPEGERPTRREILRHRSSLTSSTGSVLVAFDKGATRAQKARAVARVGGEVAER